MYYDKYESPLGILWLTGCAGMLTGLSFCEQVPKDMDQAAPEEFDSVKHWLDDYFRGVPREMDFSMNPQGTPFQKRIWKLLMEVPFGETKTYGALAREAARLLGKEKMSAQAVGQAVGKNPIAIIIPCHRIIGADGTLTGYASGLERKQWLLDHEHREQEAHDALRRF